MSDYGNNGNNGTFQFEFPLPSAFSQNGKQYFHLDFDKLPQEDELRALEKKLRDQLEMHPRLINDKVHFSRSTDRNVGSFFKVSTSEEIAFRLVLHWGKSAESYYLTLSKGAATGECIPLAPGEGFTLENEQCSKYCIEVKKETIIQIKRNGVMVNSIRPRDYECYTVVFDYTFKPTSDDFLDMLKVPEEEKDKWRETLKQVNLEQEKEKKIEE